MSGYDESSARWKQQRALEEARWQQRRALEDARWKQQLATQDARWEARIDATDARFDGIERRLTDTFERGFRDAFTDQTPLLVLSQVVATFAVAAFAFALAG